MIDFEKELAEILANDPLGLLVHKPRASSATTADERLVASFEEISAFIDTKGQVPTKGRDIGERKLASRLEGLRADPEKAASLLEFDRHDLLAGVVPIPNENPATAEINSIEDVLADDRESHPVAREADPGAHVELGVGVGGTPESWI